MIQLVPHVYYHPEETVIDACDYNQRRDKGEPVFLTLAVVLGLSIAAGISTGTTALVKGPQDLQHGLNTLQATMTQDIKVLESSVTKLEESLTSLSELVLQNRRGLDLLFLQKGDYVLPLKKSVVFTLITLELFHEQAQRKIRKTQTRPGGHTKLVRGLVQQIAIDDDFAFSPNGSLTDLASSADYRTLYN